MKNTTNLKVPKKYQSRVEVVTQEYCDDSEGLAYVIYLNDGWCAGDDYGVQTLTEYSKKEALSRLRDTVTFQ